MSGLICKQKLGMRVLFWSLLILMTVGVGQAWAETDDLEARIELLESLVAELHTEAAERDRTVQAQLRGVNRNLAEALEGIETNKNQIRTVQAQLWAVNQELTEALERIEANKTWLDSLIHRRNWTLTEFMDVLVKQQDVLETMYGTLASSLIELDTPPPVMEAPPRVPGDRVLTPTLLWGLEGQPYRFEDARGNISMAYDSREERSIGGVIYSEIVIVENTYSRDSRTGSVWFNLRGEVDRIEGLAAVDDNSPSPLGTVLTVKENGTNIFEMQFKPGELPKEFSIDVRGVSVFVLEWQIGGSNTFVMMDP